MERAEADLSACKPRIGLQGFGLDKLNMITPHVLNNNRFSHQRIHTEIHHLAVLMSLHALSTELQQNVIGYLDFMSLLALKNTNTYWRELVNNSLSKPGVILPARIKLLRLYQELHLYPSFLRSREYIMSEIQPFSRAEYLSTLQRQIIESFPDKKFSIPIEFELWILEWPEHAVIGSIWPGLDDDEQNMLPCLDAVERTSWDPKTGVAGLYVEYYGCTLYCILFFDCGEERDGMVWNGDICELTDIEDWEDGENLAGSWTEWLRRELKKR